MSLLGARSAAAQHEGTHREPAIVLEVAILEVRPGESDAFEASFREAQRYIAASPGYQRHELRRCLEAGDRHLLLVWWDDLESHTEGFRGSEAYQHWRALLHHYYDPFPTVEHYEVVDGATGSAGPRKERP